MSALQQLLLNMQQISLYATMVHHMISCGQGGGVPRADREPIARVCVPLSMLFVAYVPQAAYTVGAEAATRG